MKRHSKSLIELLTQNLDSVDNGCEVGVWEGENAAELLKAFPFLTLTMVDRYKALDANEAKYDVRMASRLQPAFDDAWKAALKNTAFAGKKAILFAMTSTEGAARVVDHHFDFVFIDGMHDYENVKNDVSMWHPKVRKGGILCGHDYGGQEDRSGKFGVKRAVDEWAAVEKKEIWTKPGHVWWCFV